MFSLKTPPCRVLILSLIFAVTGTVSAQSPAEEQAFLEAQRYYSAGVAEKDRFQKARYMNHVIKLYTDYLGFYGGSPNEVAARFQLGYAYQVMGRIDDARKTYRFLIKRHRRGNYVGSAARQLAYLAFVEEKWEEAAKYFSIAGSQLTEERYRYAALTKEVECLLKLNRKPAASVALRKIMETPQHPHRDWATFMLGYQHFQAEDYETAIATLKPLIDPELSSEYRSQALFYTGLASAELGLPDAQDSHLRTILDMSERDPSLTRQQRRDLATNKARAQISLMGLFSKRKDWDEVIALFEKGDFGATGKLEGKRCLRAGKAYLIKQRYQQARACFRQVDRAMPKTEAAFLSSFQCLKCDYYLGNPALPERVDVFFEIYSGRGSRHAVMHEARFYKAQALFDRNNLEKAARTFQKIDRHALAPAFQRELLIKHGWCQSETGQFDGATRSFSYFLADFPNDSRVAEVYNKRAEAYLALGDDTSALRDFETVLSLDADAEQRAFALQGSGRVLRQEKKYQGMLSRYRRILQEFPDLPTDTIANANYWIGWGFHKLGQYADAPPYLRKARDLAPIFYSQPAGDLLILGAFNMRDKAALDTALQEVFAQAPEKPVPSNMLSWLGVQMFHDGEVERAAFYLDRAIDLREPERTDIGVWRILAKAQNRSSKFTSAQATSELLLKLSKEPRWQADAYLDLAEARLGLRLLAETRDAVEKGLALKTPGPHEAGLHIILGEAFLLEKNAPEALASFEQAMPMIPDDPIWQPRALFGAAYAAERGENANLADRYRSKLKERFPSWKATATFVADLKE